MLFAFFILIAFVFFRQFLAEKQRNWNKPMMTKELVSFSTAQTVSYKVAFLKNFLSQLSSQLTIYLKQFVDEYRSTRYRGSNWPLSHYEHLVLFHCLWGVIFIIISHQLKEIILPNHQDMSAMLYAVQLLMRDNVEHCSTLADCWEQKTICLLYFWHKYIGKGLHYVLL